MTTNHPSIRNAAATTTTARDILSESTVPTCGVPVRTVSAQYVAPRALSPRDDAWSPRPLGEPVDARPAAHGSGRKT